MTIDSLVKIKTRTMLVFKSGKPSAWLNDDAAEMILAAARKCRIHTIAYVVRCRPRFRR